MDRSYRSIWNGTLDAWVAVSEITRTCGKRGSATVATGAAALLLTAMSPAAQALTCTVSNNTDAGVGSLRGCVADSNASNPAPATSNAINANGAQTITPATGGINITRSVEVGTGGDALTYQMTSGTRGLVLPAGTSGVHLVLGEKFKLIGANIANFQAVTIDSAGNTVDLLGTIDLGGGLFPNGKKGIVANGGNNVINVSGTIQGYNTSGAAIQSFGDQNMINVSGTLFNTGLMSSGSVIRATGNRNVIDVSGTINARGSASHYGINISGNDNQLNISGSVTDTVSNSPFGGSNGVIGVAGDNNSINISGSVISPGISPAHHGIDVNSGTNNSIIVQSNGTVSASGVNAIVFKGTGTSILTNHGTITGGVTMSDGGSSLTNYGTITGNVVGGGAISLTSSLTNYGTITGDVTMSNGGSALSIDTGSTISGAVNGGTSGNNLLRLIGNGTDSYDGSFTDFQKLEVNAAGGMWSLLNNQAYANGTSILAGTLSVNSILGGTMEVHGGRLQGTGQVGDTTNFTGGTIAPGNSIGTLLIAGNYTGSGGVLEMEAALAGTGSPADRLLITGNATGNTMVNVINTGGAGAPTGTSNTDGISIIQVGGTSTASTFQLAGGYAAVGPFQYTLNAFDPATSAVTEVDPLLAAVPFWDYRLQSLIDSSGKPVAVPQVAGYQAMPTGAVRYGASLLDSVHKRLGEIRETATLQNKIGSTEQRSKEVFLRMQGSSSDVSGNSASGYDQDIWYVQAGGNLFGRDMADDAKLRIGGALSIGGSKLNADESSAKVDLRGTTLALTSTYQAATGWYLDAVAQGTRYTSEITTSQRGETGDPKGLGWGLSLEGGYPFDIGNGLILEPQAQLSYQRIHFDKFTDVDSIDVDLNGGESLRGRFGGRVLKTITTDIDRQWTPYIEANLLHEFLSDGSITASNVRFDSESMGTGLQLGGGLNARLGLNSSVFASLSYEKGLTSASADVWGGNVGVRVDF